MTPMTSMPALAERSRLNTTATPTMPARSSFQMLSLVKRASIVSATCIGRWALRVRANGARIDPGGGQTSGVAAPPRGCL